MHLLAQAHMQKGSFVVDDDDDDDAHILVALYKCRNLVIIYLSLFMLRAII